MTPAELQQLLITHAPDVPGIVTAAARRDDENPYGLTVTLEGGGRAWWTITGASPAGTDPGNGTPAVGLAPAPAPDLTGRPVPVAQVEQALIATAVARAGDQISHIDLQHPPRPTRRPLRRHHRVPRRLEALPVLLRHYPPRPAAPRPALSPRQPHLAFHASHGTRPGRAGNPSGEPSQVAPRCQYGPPPPRAARTGFPVQAPVAGGTAEAITAGVRSQTRCRPTAAVSWPVKALPTVPGGRREPARRQWAR
jgi:hypothetical protein